MGSWGWVQDLLQSLIGRAGKVPINESGRLLFYVFFYAVFANLPYWMAAREFGFVPLGWFSAEYLIIGVLALFIPRLVSSLLLFVTILLDLLCAVCLSYYLPIQEIFANIGAAHAFVATRLILACSLVLFAAMTAAIATILPGTSLRLNHKVRLAISLVCLAIIVIGIDTVSIRFATGALPNLLPRSLGPDAIKLNMSDAPRFVRIPIIRLVKIEASYAGAHTLERPTSAPTSVPNATSIALHSAGIRSSRGRANLPNIVQIVVESWGIAEDASLKDALVQPYFGPNLLARYRVVQGSVPFNGPTIPGEARELCGNSLGFHLLAASANDLNNCIPNQLASLGYYGIAAHGMNGHMFNRSQWYGTIGFQEEWFHEDFKRIGLRDCRGALIGTCDADVAAWIGRRLDEDNGRPYFVHWMTLNSHLPVLVPSPLTDGAPCTVTRSLSPDSPLCSWYQLVAEVHRSIAQIAVNNLARPTVFVIVGDHAPPFGNPALRNRFSQFDVPYVILLPLTGRESSRMVLAHNVSTPVRGAAKASRQTP